LFNVLYDFEKGLGVGEFGSSEVWRHGRADEDKDGKH
jgi:hypothetical protein